MIAGTPAFLSGNSLVVNTSDSYQTIDGFGACIISYDLLPAYRDPAFYDRAVFDLGLSILRIPIADLETFANDNDDPNNFDWDSFDPEPVGLVMEMARQFQARGVDHILGTPWSPPGWMKTNNFASLGGRLRPDRRDEYAEYLSAYVQMARKYFGVTIDTISLQNELLFVEPYESCVYNPLQLREALRTVSARFSKELPDVRLLVAEDMGWADRFILYIEPLMADPETRRFHGLFGSHGWNGAANWRKMAANLAPFEREFWMTETSGHNPDWKGGMALAESLHDILSQGNASAYIYWQFEAREPGRFSLLASGEFTPKSQALRHFARFVRPGSKRVHVGGKLDGLQVSAYKHPLSGQVTVVLINPGDDAVSVDLNLIDPDGVPENWLTFTSREDEYLVPDEVMTPKGISVPATGMVTAVGKCGTRLSEIPPLRPQDWEAPEPGPALTVESGRVIDERLHGAARANDLERVEALLVEGVDPNALNAGRFSPLHRAAWPGHVDVIAPLIAAGADPNRRGGGGGTPIHVAVMNGRDAFIKALAASGANVDLPNDEGVTPVQLAALGGHLSTIQTLLDLGAEPNRTDHRGWTALHWAAASSGHSSVEIIELLLQQGADPGIVDSEGRTPLHVAAANFANPRVGRGGSHGPAGGRRINAERLRALIDAGAEVNARDDEGRTPLHWAAWLGETRYGEDVAHRPSFTYEVEGVRFLLSAGADSQVIDQSGRTPADYAREEGYLETVGLLEDALVVPWLTGHSGPPRSSSGLITAGADAGIERARSLKLREAASNGDLEKLRAVLTAGADPNVLGGGALHDAVIAGQREAVRILLEAGADPDQRDSDGYTALDRARQNNLKAIVELLRSWSASAPETP